MMKEGVVGRWVVVVVVLVGVLINKSCSLAIADAAGAAGAAAGASSVLSKLPIFQFDEEILSGFSNANKGGRAFLSLRLFLSW